MKEKLIYLFLLFSLTANSQDSLFVDCYGTDASGVINWVGDGYCDDGAWGIEDEQGNVREHPMWRREADDDYIESSSDDPIDFAFRILKNIV